jgi:hypothetical protein
MTSRERLHRIVDHLPDPAVDLAIRLLEALEDEPTFSLDSAPVDDEIHDEDFDGRLDEARRGEQPLSHEEIVRRHLG